MSEESEVESVASNSTNEELELWKGIKNKNTIPTLSASKKKSTKPKEQTKKCRPSKFALPDKEVVRK